MLNQNCIKKTYTIFLHDNPAFLLDNKARNVIFRAKKVGPFLALLSKALKEKLKPLAHHSKTGT